jgi:hypothetical protein
MPTSSVLFIMINAESKAVQVLAMQALSGLGSIASAHS